MEKVVFGYAVTRERVEAAVKAFAALDEYMDETAKNALDKRMEALFLFDLSERKMSACAALVEADVMNEMESSGKSYVSMSTCDPHFFAGYVLSVVQLTYKANGPTGVDELTKAAESTEVAKPTAVVPSGTESVKNDRKDHKVRWDLIPMEPINEIAKVYTAGADKYGPDRWQNLEDGFNRYRGAACRHLFEYMQGHRYDEETKCMHLAQCAWNVIAMIYLDMHGRGLFPFSTLKPASLDGGELDKYEGDSPVEKLMNMLKLKSGGE